MRFQNIRIPCVMDQKKQYKNIKPDPQFGELHGNRYADEHLRQRSRAQHPKPHKEVCRYKTGRELRDFPEPLRQSHIKSIANKRAGSAWGVDIVRFIP